MKEPENHPQEGARQAALDALQHVDSPAERRFDIITEAAKETLKVPIVLISLIHGDKQWFKSAQGIAAAETPRCISFCGHAILQRDIFEVEDASVHPDFKDNPLVTKDPNIRYYAGVPVTTESGLPLGTLCVIDTQTRKLDELARKRMRSLASWVEVELRNRGLSSMELDYLATTHEGRPDGFMDADTKVWNREAGMLLLAGKLEASEQEAKPLTVGVVHLRLLHGEWSDLAEQGHAAELRLRFANLIRANMSGEATYFAESPDVLTYMSGMPGEEVVLTALMSAARQLSRFLQEQRSMLKVSLTGAVCRVEGLGGRQKDNILSRLVDAAKSAPAQSMQGVEFG